MKLNNTFLITQQCFENPHRHPVCVCVFLRLCGLDLASGSALFTLVSKAHHSFRVVFIPPSSTICTEKVFSQAVAFHKKKKKKILSFSLSPFLSPSHTHLDEIWSFDTLSCGFLLQIILLDVKENTLSLWQCKGRTNDIFGSVNTSKYC